MISVNRADGRKTVPSEFGLIAATVVNALSVSLIVKADFGISTLTSVPLIVSYVFEFFSFGMWNFLFQTLFLTVLVVVTRNPDPRYLLSFVLAMVFGTLLDMLAPLTAFLPSHLMWRILYFAVGFLILIPGISLYLKCRLPPLPFDAFVRDIADYFGFSVKWVRTPLDIFCLIVTVTVSLVLLGEIRAVGIGTIFSALALGPLLGEFCTWMDRRLTFEPRFAISVRLAKKSSS